MKNQEEVFRLLVGESRPNNANASAELLRALLATGEANQNDEVCRRCGYELRNLELEASDAATMFKALIIALPFSYKQLPDVVRHGYHTIANIGGKHIPAGPYGAGFMVGWIEAAVWLREHNEDNFEMNAGFPMGLADFICKSWDMGNHFPSLDNKLSGRLSNVSGKFVQNSDCTVLFNKILQMEPHHFKGHFRDDYMDGGAQQIITELTLRALLQLPTRNRIRILVAQASSKQVAVDVVTPEDRDRAFVRAVVGTGP